MTELEQKIRDAGLHNPIVHHCLTIQKINKLTWTETLALMAVALIESNQQFQDAAIAKAHRSPQLLPADDFPDGF